MDVKADFILSSWNSGFAEKRINSDGKVKGIFSAATVGPCDGENSDFFPAGDPNYTHKYSTCRPQLHAAGIGTWLWADYCEDPSLKPVGGATEDTVYDAENPIRAAHDSCGQVPRVGRARRFLESRIETLSVLAV